MEIKKEQGLRYNKGKVKYSLIPKSAIKELASVLTYGAEKYTVRDDKGNIISDGSNNWRKGLTWQSVRDSIDRHLAAFDDSQDFDDESHLLHLGHVMANVSFLIDFYKTFPEGDNRNHKYLNQKRIAFDIDGVLASFSEAFKNKAKEMGLLKIDEDITQYHWDFPDYLQPVWDTIKNDRDFWLNLEPLCGHQFNYDIIAYVSSREIPQEWSKEWLDKNNFPPAPVYHTNGDTKLEILKSLSIDLFVDDSYKNFVNLNKNGICTFLFDAEYNRKYDVGYKRLTDLKNLV